MIARIQSLSREKKLVFGGLAVALLLIVAASVFAPLQDEKDPRPVSTNPGPAGAKALWVLLPRLGYRVERSEAPLTGLAAVDAPHTTLLLASPWGNVPEDEQHALSAFLERGGRVLATGLAGNANLPGFYWQNGDNDHAPERCVTSPEGTSALAAVGPVHLPVFVLARTDLPEVDAAQTCAGGAAVIDYPWGKGMAVWWASADPLTNRGLHDGTNLQLVLNSLGSTDRTILFSESEGGYAPVSPWSRTAGLPLAAMLLQLAFAALLLFLGFGRRHGPVRTLSTTPRTSPLEFAFSMGNLYHRAGAGEAATHEARARLMHLLERGCALPRETLHGPATGIANILQARFGYANAALPALLDQSAGDERLPPARALTMVQALDAICADLGRILNRRTQSPKPEETLD